MESRLPGLATWARVRDYRTNLIKTMPKVDIYLDSPMTLEGVMGSDFQTIVVATGARWTTDILSVSGYPIEELAAENIFTPDQVLCGTELVEPVLIYDFDHYYMGSCLAELLRASHKNVTIITPASAVSAWTTMTNECAGIRQRMIDLGVKVLLEHYVTGMTDHQVQLSSIYNDSSHKAVEAGSLVIVGLRKSQDSLLNELKANRDELQRTDNLDIRAVGDCVAPGAISHAIYSGYECGRNFGLDDSENRWMLERSII